MVITVTFNPIVDYTAALPTLDVHQLNRVPRVRRDPSGKGLNVSRILAALGVPSRPFCLLGGDQGRYIHDFLIQQGLAPEVTWIGGETRLGLKLFETTTSLLTEINEEGPEIAPAELAGLVDAVKAACRPGDWLVLSGSLPRAVPETIYAELARFARERGIRVALDADREAFRLAVQERPYLVKPNAFEAGQFLGEQVCSEEEVRAAALRLREYAEVVFLTLGERGAALAAEGVYVRVLTPPVVARSTAGCGDTFLAAGLAALLRGLPWPEVARRAVAASAAAAELEGTSFPRPERMEELLAFTRARADSQPKDAWRPPGGTPP